MADLAWSDKIIDAAEDRSHCGLLERPTHHGEATNPACGDRAVVALQVDAGRIERIVVNVSGCTLSKAAGALLAEEVDGLPIGFCRLLTDAEMVALVGIDRHSPKAGCAILPLLALRQAVGRREVTA